MSNRIVIFFPLIVLLLSLSLAVSYAIQDDRVLEMFPFLKVLNTHTLISTIPLDLKTNPETLYTRINQDRRDNNLSPFQKDDNVCQIYDSSTTNDTDQQDIFGICPDCIKASLIKIPKFATVEVIFAQLINQTSIKETINNEELTLLCIKEDPEYLTLLFAAQKSNESPSPDSPPVKYVTVAPTTPKDFTEDELWAALISYRHAHQVSDLQFSESLCQYARKRVAQHIEKFETTNPEDYPVLEKYPLDAHAGFAQDAESNYVFDVTGMNHVAENLAYWPTAESAVHVIEWGWDSSTEGHREAQLSEEFSHACISGSQGFFVAIFGSN